jgi:hypothetical protein
LYSGLLRFVCNDGLNFVHQAKRAALWPPFRIQS